MHNCEPIIDIKDTISDILQCKTLDNFYTLLIYVLLTRVRHNLCNDAI